MLKFLWVIMELLLYALAGCVVLIIPACILDFICGNKNGNVEKKRASSSGACGVYGTEHRHMNPNHQFDRDIQATASRMAQEAHDSAVQDSWSMHDDACHTAQQAHDTAVFDHQAAVDLHDHVVSDHGFGCCGPFF